MGPEVDLYADQGHAVFVQHAAFDARHEQIDVLDHTAPQHLDQVLLGMAACLVRHKQAIGAYRQTFKRIEAGLIAGRQQGIVLAAPSGPALRHVRIVRHKAHAGVL